MTDAQGKWVGSHASYNRLTTDENEMRDRIFKVVVAVVLSIVALIGFKVGCDAWFRQMPACWVADNQTWCF